MPTFQSLPESEADQILRQEFGRLVKAIGFSPAERRWSWVRDGKDPIRTAPRRLRALRD